MSACNTCARTDQDELYYFGTFSRIVVDSNLLPSVQIADILVNLDTQLLLCIEPVVITYVDYKRFPVYYSFVDFGWFQVFETNFHVKIFYSPLNKKCLRHGPEK